MENTGANFSHSVRQCEGGEPCAAPESVVADCGNAIGQCERGQTTAVMENTAVNCCDTWRYDDALYPGFMLAQSDDCIVFDTQVRTRVSHLVALLFGYTIIGLSTSAVDFCKQK